MSRHDTVNDLLYSRELVERVEREARGATALPWWFYEVAAIIFVITVAASAAWPWGWAT